MQFLKFIQNLHSPYENIELYYVITKLLYIKINYSKNKVLLKIYLKIFFKNFIIIKQLNKAFNYIKQ